MWAGSWPNKIKIYRPAMSPAAGPTVCCAPCPKGRMSTGILNTEILDSAGNVLRLGDFADIQRVAPQDESVIYLDGKPAVEFRIKQKSGGDALASAEAIGKWMEKTAATLPPGVHLKSYYERWRSIESRLSLLLKNGMQGMLLVVLLLFLFLNGRVAFWVAAGIPATFMVAFFILYMMGGQLKHAEHVRLYYDHRYCRR